MKKIIIVLFMLSMNVIHAKQLRRLTEVKALLESSKPPAVVVPHVDQAAIIKRLDEQLLSPIESAWDERVDDLFSLATVNPELARSYFKKMSEKMAVTDVKPIEVVEQNPVEKKEPSLPEEKKITAEKTVEEKGAEPTLPVGEEPMKKSTKPAPPKKFGPKTEVAEVPKTEEVQPAVSGEEPMKVSTKPAPPKKGAPSGGPKKALTPSSSASPSHKASEEHRKATADKQKTTTESVAGEKVAPKVTEQIFSTSRLQALDDDALIKLFRGLLDKLGTVPSNWNGMVVEKVEEKTKYGSKTYNLYGAPVAKWTNDMNTLKKVLISKKIMSDKQVTQEIEDRIAQVRSQKNIKPAVSAQAEEKPKEELTEEDLVKLIKAQLAEPKKDQIGWVVSVKGNLKALDKINHEAALEYHNRFIKLTGEKTFIK